MWKYSNHFESISGRMFYKLVRFTDFAACTRLSTLDWAGDDVDCLFPGRRISLGVPLLFELLVAVVSY